MCQQYLHGTARSAAGGGGTAGRAEGKDETLRKRRGAMCSCPAWCHGLSANCRRPRRSTVRVGCVFTELFLIVVQIGPVFRTDDLMNLFRNAVIPNSSVRAKSPPPPPRSGTYILSMSFEAH